MNTTITPRTTIANLVGLWVEQRRVEQRLARTSIDEYERVLRNLVMPTLGALSIDQVETGRNNEVLLELGEQNLNRQRKAKVVLGTMLDTAVEVEALTVSSIRKLAEHQLTRA